MQIDIIYPSYDPPPPSSNFRTLRKWSELNPDDGFSSARGQPPGQTQGQQALYTPYLLKAGVWAGTWSANTNSPLISNADLVRISTLQKVDSCSVDMKMQHITNAGRGTWGQALQATYEKDWRTATNIKMNQAVYAGNQVEILERRVMKVDTFGTVPMVRIRTGWDCVNIYTGVTNDNVHYWEVKGKIFLPLLPKAGYEWWLLERWLL